MELLAACNGVRRRARRLVGTPFGAGLSGAEIELVRFVRHNPSCSVAQAATGLGVAGNTVSTLVAGLVVAGIMTRATDATDRRVARLTLTATAGHRLDDWLGRRAASVDAAIAALPARDRATLRRAIPVLTALADRLDKQLDEQEVS